MTLVLKNGNYYGQSWADLREFIAMYSQETGYVAQHFADATCDCSETAFSLALDDNEGVAVRTCTACAKQYPIADSSEYLEEAELDECACPCGTDALEISMGVSLYSDSLAVRWLYLGCRCPQCGLVGVYGDWKNEFEDYRQLLNKV